MRLMKVAILTAAVAARAVGTARADSVSPSDAIAVANEHYRRGFTYSEGNDFQGALPEFEQANKLHPSRKTHLALGGAYAELKRPVEAIDNIDRALDRTSNLPWDLDDALVATAKRVRDVA